MSRHHDRQKRLQRLLQATRQLKRLEEMNTLELEGRLQRLRQQRRAMLRSLVSSDVFGGELARLLQRNLEALASAQASLEQEHARGQEQLRMRRLQERQMERLQQRAAGNEQRRHQRDALLQAVEQSLHRRRH